MLRTPNEKLAFAKDTFVIYKNHEGNERLGMVDELDMFGHALVRIGSSGPQHWMPIREIRQATEREIEDFQNAE